MRCIYIDVLIIVNIYVNYFLLLATSKLTHTPITLKRLIFASVVGSFFSLVILLPKMNFILNMLIKLVTAGIVTGMGFGFGGKFLKKTAWFFAVNLIFGGIMLGLWLCFRPSFIRFNNNYFYLDFSLLSLIVFTAISYFAVCFVRYLMDRGTGGEYEVFIRLAEKSVGIKGIADTGNLMTDFFNGKPIIICGRKNIEKILKVPVPQAEDDWKGFRPIPCGTIGGTGIIPVFKADEVIIYSGKEGKKVDAEIGISNEDVEAIFNPKIIV